MIELVNEYRTAEGLDSLVMDTVLLDAAMKRAAELSVFYSHTRPDDTQCFTICDWRNAVGENIAIMNYISDADGAMTGWMNSQRHKDNILSESFTSIGVGVFELDGNQYWVQLFDGGTPREASNNKTLESADFVINVDNSKLNLQTIQNTSVSFQCDSLLNGKTFAIDGIYNVNIGWDYASLIIDKADISYKSADPEIAEVDSKGTITPKSLGNVSVTAYLNNFPDKAITYKVSVEHEFTDWTISKNPTCVRDGESVSKCKICTETQTQIIAATGKHTYDNGMITENPNCITAGKMQYTCTTPDCELYYIETIPMTGDHKYDSGVIQDDEIIYSCQTPGCTASYAEKIEIVTETEPETEPEPDIESETDIIAETELIETTIPEAQSDPIESNEIIKPEPEEEQSTNLFRIALTVIVFIAAILLLINVRLINVSKKKINKKSKRKR